MRNDITSIRRDNSRAKIFGVCAGIARWADLDVRTFQTIVFLIVLFTGFFPGAFIYLILALIIPADDSVYTSSKRRHHKHSTIYEDDDDDERTNEELRTEYENLKKKVETMENEMFDKERDWDQRFHQN